MQTKQASEAWQEVRDWINALSVRPAEQQKIAEFLHSAPMAHSLRNAAFKICVEKAQRDGAEDRKPYYTALLATMKGIVGDAAMPPKAGAKATSAGSGVKSPEELVKDIALEDIGGLIAKLEALIEGAGGSGKAAIDPDQVRAIVKEEMAVLPPREIIIRSAEGGEVRRVAGPQHKKFSELLELSNMRLADGFRPNIFIFGPPGSGKTYGALGVFDALGLQKEYNGALSMSYDVLGYRDAGGTYQDTAFYRGYTGPCGYLFDDVDRCETSGPLTALNGALAGASAGFPNGLKARHPDSLIMATGNTNGLGANSDFPGALRIDAAWMDRFHYRLEWGYDEGFERSLYGRGAEIAQRARRGAESAGLKGVWITPRASAAIKALLDLGKSEEYAKDMTYRAILTAEQRRQMP